MEYHNCSVVGGARVCPACEKSMVSIGNGIPWIFVRIICRDPSSWFQLGMANGGGVEPSDNPVVGGCTTNYRMWAIQRVSMC